MPEPSPSPGVQGGLLASLRGAIRTSLEGVETRLGIFATELEQERIRLVGLMFWGGVFLFALFLGIVMLTIFLVVAFWDTQRLLVLGVLTGFFLGAALVIGLGLRLWNRDAGKPFQATLNELSKDRDHLGS